MLQTKKVNTVECLTQIAKGNLKVNTNLDLIMNSVASVFFVSIDEMKSRKRDENTATARQIAMYLLRQETNYSLGRIGREFGNRSSATVAHDYQKIANGISHDPLKYILSEIQGERERRANLTFGNNREGQKR